MKSKDLTKKVLKEVANELSKVMDFEEPIKTGNKTTIESIKSDLIEAAKELREDDKITEESKEVLIEIGIKLPWKVEKREEKPKVTKSKSVKKKTKKEEKSIKKEEIIRKESAKKEKLETKKAIEQKSKNKDNSAVQNSANFIMAEKNFTKKELTEHILSSKSCGSHYSKLIADISIKLLSAMEILGTSTDNNTFKLKKQ